LNADRAPQLKRSVMLLRIIRTDFFFQLILSLGIVLAGNFAILAQTKNPTPSPSPIHEKPEQEVPTEDKVYSAKEVDVKAKVLRPLENQPQPGDDCGGRMRLVVIVRAVLHRSGEVKEAELIQESGCSSYDKDALHAVGLMKFLRALKDNRFVSQYQVFEFQYSRF
jgi:outer membrane biosynthesis protein TonB